MTTSEYYDQYWSDDGFRPRARPTALRELIAAHVSGRTRVIDYGCGDGHSVGTWVAARSGTYVGFDVSATAVAEARSLGLNASVVEPGAPLPAGDGTFDLALAIEVLEHLFAPHLAAEELLRVLAPGATLIVTVPNIAYWRQRVNLAAFGRWNPVGDALSVEQPWRDPHLRFFTSASLRRLLERAGFAQIRLSGQLGSLIHDAPAIRRLARRERGASAVYRRLERACPSLLALRLVAVAHKPEGR